MRAQCFGQRGEVRTDSRSRVFHLLSPYDKKGLSIPPDQNAGEDGLGDLTLSPEDAREPFDSLDLSIGDIKKVVTNKRVMTIKISEGAVHISTHLSA